jgi:hypothetical protein
LNVLALGLPLCAGLRAPEKTFSKVVTLLVSQSSMGPHLVTDVDGELTTSHVAALNSIWVRGCIRGGRRREGEGRRKGEGEVCVREWCRI